MLKFLSSISKNIGPISFEINDTLSVNIIGTQSDDAHVHQCERQG